MIPLAAAAFAWTLAATGTEPAAIGWPQWGGPERDFHAPAGALAESWPASGPPRRWSRELGPGHSAILFENGRLYTMYRAGREEIVACLDAATGKTLWEQRWARPREIAVPQFGAGPHATPLIAGPRLFAAGIAGTLVALDKADGRLLWRRELWDAPFGGTALPHGYSSSPLALGATVVVPVGGDTAGLVAFDAATGEVAWRSAPFRNSYSSPRVLRLLGEEQIVTCTAEGIVGVAARSGAPRWQVAHANPWGHNVAAPVAVGDDVVFFSSPQSGAKAVRLSRDGDRIGVEELWSSARIQFYHVSSVAVGDWVYGSSGTSSPAFLLAVNVRTGEVAWRERGFSIANCVAADGKLVILDDGGTLALARATPEGFAPLARTQLLERPAWTVPTIVGGTLYARSANRILAVALDGPAAPREPR